LKSHPKKDFDYIPHSRPTLGAEEIKAVSEVIASGQLAEADVVSDFESAFAKRIGAKYAVATSSGTASLHLALLSLGIGENDEVIIPSFVCTALLNAVNYVGAIPVLAEIDPETFNLDPDDVKSRLTPRTKAIIVPHMFGLAADLDSLLQLGVPILEDCAQSVGAHYRQKPLGALGVASVFSFYATKVMTSGEGGMLVSNSKKIADLANDLKTYDKRDRYKIRFNYKMTEIQAVLGLNQLKQLNTFIERRQSIARAYTRAFKGLDIQLPFEDPDHIYYRFVAQMDGDVSTIKQLVSAKGIGCERPIYLPLHCLMNIAGYSVAEQAWEKSLSIPIYPSLTSKEVDRVIEIFTETLKTVGLS
jgi:dTDP-4-amino-4,6-dideoxygalactose transaminase